VGGRRRASLNIGLGLIVSAVCLWLAVQQAPISELGEVLGQAQYQWLGLAVILNVFTLWARGCRWRVLLTNQGTRQEYFWAQCIGSMLTNIFPLRAGEAGRVVIISRRVGLPLVQVGASLIVERALDMAVLLSLLAVLLLVMDVPWGVAATGLALGAAVAVAWVGVVVLLVFRRQATILVELVAVRLPDRLAKLVRLVWTGVLTALEPLRSIRVVARVIGWSLLIWAAGIGTFWVAIEAVVPGGSLLEASFALTAVAFGVALPSSPGFIGVFQFIAQQALVTPFPHRYTAASALAIALLNHAAFYIPNTLLGLVGLARLGLSLRSVRQPASVEAQVAAQETSPRPPAPAAEA
jgi:uncharacterized membrane protein YbhN (UPF0104 family)